MIKIFNQHIFTIQLTFNDAEKKPFSAYQTLDFLQYIRNSDPKGNRKKEHKRKKKTLVKIYVAHVVK